MYPSDLWLTHLEHISNNVVVLSDAVVTALVPTGGRFAHLPQVPVDAVDYEKFDLCTTGLDRDTWLLLVGLTLSHALSLCRLVASHKCTIRCGESNIAVLGSDFSNSHRHFDAISLSLKSGKTMTRFSQAQNSCVLEALQCRQ